MFVVHSAANENAKYWIAGKTEIGMSNLGYGKSQSANLFAMI